jgi:hypothetical protein
MTRGPAPWQDARIAGGCPLSTRLVLALGLALVLPACAGNYFRAYQKAHPDWVFVFPDQDANLEQTVASLYAPAPLGTQLSIRRLELLRVDTEPWQPIPFEELRSGSYASTDEADYAVVANVQCIGRVDLQTYRGEKVAWYLLRKNRLRAFDHYEFVEACTVSNLFVPAPMESAAVERALQEHIAAEYPRSMVHVAELYQKGLVYARLDRIEDAKRMLNAGRRGFDSSGDDKPTEFETPGVTLEVRRADDARSLHDQLVREIMAAEARLAAK